MIYHGVSLVSHGTIISNRDANREPCLCAVRRRVVAAAPDARSSFSISNKRCFRTSLQKNCSLVPGNGILPAETNVPEWPLRQTSHLKETNHAHETRLFRVIPPQMGKSLFAPDCVVGLGGLELPTKRLSVASSEY